MTAETNLRVAVMGAGAIGMLMGYRLGLAGHAVTLIGRPAMAEAAAEAGITIYDAAGVHRLNADVVTSVDQVPALPDLIVMTVKAFDTGLAAEQIAPIVRRGVPILLVQNGVGGEAAGLEILPSAQWYGAVTTMVAERLGPAEVRQSKRSASLVIAPLANVNDLGWILGVFHGSGFDEVRPCDSYDAMKWSKLLLNILGNAVPAIVDMPPAAVFANRTLFAIEHSAYLEALAVMRQAQIRVVSLPGYPVTWLARAMRWLPAPLLRPMLARLIAGGRGGKMPSLHMDLTGGRTNSEVQFLNGAVARQGEVLHVATPVNRAISEVLLAIARGEERWGRYRGHPEVLAARCGL